MYCYYHALPSALIRPNTPKNLDSTGVDDYTDMKPIDYTGLHIIVRASGTVATNWLYRLDF
jgi:hypothetical protein